MPVTTVENAFSFCSLDEKHIKAEEKKLADYGAISEVSNFFFFLNNISFRQGIEWVGGKLSLTPS